MSEEKAVVITPDCPACEALKQRLQEKGKLDKYRFVDASTPEGRKFAEEMGIDAVPTCIVLKPVKGGHVVRTCTEAELEKLYE